jgi:hypothetical protein
MKNFFIPSPFDVRGRKGEGERERVKECKSKFECNLPLSLTLSHKLGREEKIKTNPSVSPFRKGRN